MLVSGPLRWSDFDDASITGTMLEQMSAEDTSAGGKGGRKVLPRSGSEKPDWSNGLRKLYDSVLDEPLPDTFKDLLSKLDDKG